MLCGKFIRAAIAAVCLIGVNCAYAGPADELKSIVEQRRFQDAWSYAQQNIDTLGQPDFDYYYGLAAIETGHLGEAIIALERYIIRFPYSPRVRLDLARAYFLNQENQRAKTEFENVLISNPPADLVAIIERFLDQIRIRQSETRPQWNAWVEASAGNDSNVNGGVSQAGIQLPVLGAVTVTPGGQRIGSNFYGMAGGASYSYALQRGFVVYGGASGGLRAHTSGSAERFDLANYGAFGGLSYRTEGNHLLRAGLNYGQLLLESDQFRTVSGINVDWTIPLGNTQSLTLGAQAARLTYQGVNTVRDANAPGVSVAWRKAFTVAWQPVLSLNVGRALEDNRQSRPDLGRRIDSVRIGVDMMPLPRLSVGVAVSHAYSAYDGPDIILLTTRRDRLNNLDVGAGYAFNRNWSLRAEAAITRNRSNLALYEFDRNQYLIKLRYDFK